MKFISFVDARLTKKIHSCGLCANAFTSPGLGISSRQNSIVEFGSQQAYFIPG
jgi:hypothetical protein